MLTACAYAHKSTNDCNNKYCIHGLTLYKALTTRIRFHLKTQLFCYGYGYRPHVYDANDNRRRNFSKTLSKVELFENAVLPFSRGQTKTKLFENADVTLPVPGENDTISIWEGSVR